MCLKMFSQEDKGRIYLANLHAHLIAHTSTIGKQLCWHIRGSVRVNSGAVGACAQLSVVFALQGRKRPDDYRRMGAGAPKPSSRCELSTCQSRARTGTSCKQRHICAT